MRLVFNNYKVLRVYYGPQTGKQKNKDQKKKTQANSKKKKVNKPPEKKNQNFSFTLSIGLICYHNYNLSSPYRHTPCLNLFFKK